MKLKYYLRGLGVGIICTAILMGIALSGNKKEKLTDTEIIERARLLGMVMAEEAPEEEGDPSQEDGSTESTEGQCGQKESPEGKGQEPGAGSQEGKSQASQDGSKGKEPKSQDGSKAGEGPASGNTEDPAEEPEGPGNNTPASASQEEGQAGEAPANQPSGMVEFEISERDHSEDVSQKLFQAGLIQDAASFNQHMTEEGMDEHLQTGKYQIPAGATEEEILEMIVRLP